LHIIAKRKLREYYTSNAQAKLPLIEWYSKMSGVFAGDLMALRAALNAGVDAVHGYTVFNIGGNNYRLITAVHYNTQRCYVREIWTHAEYSEKQNQDKLKGGDV